METPFPKDRIRVLLLEGIHPSAAALLQAEGFMVDCVPKALEGRALERALAEVHLLGIRSKTTVTREAVAAAPRLLAIGAFCIGTNQVDVGAACAAGVPVFNSPFSNTRSVAELTIAEIVALHRRLADKSAAMHAGNWEKSAEGAHEVRGRTLGIVGYGHIGSQVSVLAEAMGMRVIYHDIVARLAMGNARPTRTLAELLGQSDVVTLHVPATAQTERMISKPQFESMREGSYLINNARGSVVDLPALAAALKSGHLAGAALDVFPREPAARAEPFESPVRAMANVILTPHVAGSTEESQAAIAEDACAKLLKFVNVGSTTGAVNVPEVELPEQSGRGVENAGRAGRRHRILHFHRNVPGVLSNMHAAIAARGANIAAEYLQTNRDVGYVVLDVDPTDAEPIVRALREIPETIRVRVLW